MTFSKKSSVTNGFAKRLPLEIWAEELMSGEMANFDLHSPGTKTALSGSLSFRWTKEGRNS